MKIRNEETLISSFKFILDFVDIDSINFAITETRMRLLLLKFRI